MRKTCDHWELNLVYTLEQIAEEKADVFFTV